MENKSFIQKIEDFRNKYNGSLIKLLYESQGIKPKPVREHKVIDKEENK